jgi:AraC-like DNA-binding protein
MQQRLAAFPFIHTRSTETLEAAVTTQYGPVKIEISKRDREFDVVANHCQLQAIGLTYANHGAPVQISFESFDHYAQLFSFGGRASAYDGRNETNVGPLRAFVATPHAPLRLRYASDFEQVALKVDAATLTGKLEALNGEPLLEELRFSWATDLRRDEGRLLHRKIRLLVERLSGEKNGIHLPTLAETEQSILVSFLLANRHNHSGLISIYPRLLGGWQLKLAEDYIAANWQKPLYIETLTALTGYSARSIFYSFKRKHGHSPMVFLRQMRLDHAKRLLSVSGAATSVTEVALTCGFGNLGHFAGYYQDKFGEAPSVTMRRAKLR